MRLEPGQVALVTGAASGVGFELSRQVLARGLAVVMVDVEGDALERAARRLRRCSPNGSIMALTADVGVPGELDAVAARAFERHGAVDLLANNAGVVGPRVAVWEQSEADYRWVLDVNLGGVINGLRAFVPQMVARNHGHVLNTASIAALATVAGGGNGPYAASKHAVLGLSEVLREELSGVAPAVGVSVLCPGPVATRIREAARNRPARLTSQAQANPAAPPHFAHAVETISAERAAMLALAGVESGRFLILTQAGNATQARARLASMDAEIEGSERLSQ